MPTATTPVTSATGTSATAHAAVGSPRRNDELDKDAFLKLLVAQLRYQDPMKPSDPGEFMAQTAQFTTVEKLDLLTKQGESTNRALGLSAAANLIGRNVTWIGEDGATQTGKVDAAKSSVDGVNLSIGNKEISLEAITGLS